MSEQEIEEIKDVLNKVNTTLVWVVKSQARLEDAIYKDQLPRIEQVENAILSERDMEKFREIKVALSNSKFLVKFFTMFGATLSFIVGVVYMIVQIVKSL